MVCLFRRESEGGSYVLLLQIRKISEDLCPSDPGGKEVQNVFNANTQVANARTAAALSGIEGDAVHDKSLSLARAPVKTWGLH